jgi:hypothetical protein
MVLVKQSIGLGNYCELLKNRNEVEGVVLEVEICLLNSILMQ